MSHGDEVDRLMESDPIELVNRMLAAEARVAVLTQQLADAQRERDAWCVRWDSACKRADALRTGVLAARRGVASGRLYGVHLLDHLDALLAVPAGPEPLEARVAELTQQLADAQREHAELNDAARALADAISEARRLLGEIVASGVEDIDPRLGYVTVQVDRDDWAAAREWMEEGR